MDSPPSDGSNWRDERLVLAGVAMRMPAVVVRSPGVAESVVSGEPMTRTSLWHGNPSAVDTGDELGALLMDALTVSDLCHLVIAYRQTGSIVTPMSCRLKTITQGMFQEVTGTSPALQWLTLTQDSEVVRRGDGNWVFRTPSIPHTPDIPVFHTMDMMDSTLLGASFLRRTVLGVLQWTVAYKEDRLLSGNTNFMLLGGSDVAACQWTSFSLDPQHSDYIGEPPFHALFRKGAMLTICANTADKRCIRDIRGLLGVMTYGGATSLEQIEDRMMRTPHTRLNVLTHPALRSTCLGDELSDLLAKPIHQPTEQLCAARQLIERQSLTRVWIHRDVFCQRPSTSTSARPDDWMLCDDCTLFNLRAGCLVAPPMAHIRCTWCDDEHNPFHVWPLSVPHWGLRMECRKPEQSWPPSAGWNTSWKQNLRAGDLLDVHDTSYRWYESVVLVRRLGMVRVHYLGWAQKWDEWILLDSEPESHRLRPFHCTSVGGHSSHRDMDIHYASQDLFRGYQ